ncbi:MAG: LLM class flavin-dependent oxidoreductase [Deltaproteobacteria bacterium]|nr:LLM class flavin-dependent oxidoreductase [Deltaproteobacteria bacterium]MBW2360019.1 LLM class flavin-dependent oxidoreductase [Deltaproteobacteria bacterium]
MPLFNLRYDLRCPPCCKADSAQRFRTAIEQCEWADRMGFVSVMLSEHHGSPDGCTASPMMLGAAIAARTQKLRIMLAALTAPLHDPIRLAEDIASLDLISNGRVIVALSDGYLEPEFTAFGKELWDRKQVMNDIIPFLEKAFSGEPFEWQGRTLCVTPKPVQQPRPPIFMGGASQAAARRAAHFADAFLPTLPALYEVYRDELAKLGKPVPPAQSDNSLSSFIWVAEDPDAAWEQIAPHAMHENDACGKLLAASELSEATSTFKIFSNPDELRASGRYPILTPEELIERAGSMGPSDGLMLHPLMGGIEPDVSWQCLKLVEEKVLPALR